MQYAILDAETRVIKRLTTDEEPALSADELIVPAERVDLSAGFCVLSADGSVRPATDDEVTTAGVDEGRLADQNTQRVAALYDALQTAAADPAALPSAQAAFARLAAQFQSSVASTLKVSTAPVVKD